jgi:hypothetical protein
MFAWLYLPPRPKCQLGAEQAEMDRTRMNNKHLEKQLSTNLPPHFKRRTVATDE